MIQFQIQSDSDIPVSKQLFDQLRFAIASRQYAPGHRLPSIRQLAKTTGLHRNTISKVYRQLEAIGLVNSLTGSGIYVKNQESEQEIYLETTPLLQQYPDAHKIITESINQLIAQGCTLNQAKELFLAEFEARFRCNALVFITVPKADLGAGKLMLSELEQALLIPLQLVPIEQLNYVLDRQKTPATVITSRYFCQEVLAIISAKRIRVIPIDIYDYHKELQLIKNLPPHSCIGIVSLSSGILRGAEILIHSLHGDKLFTITAQTNDQYKLQSLVRSAYTIITDPASYPKVKQAILDAREDLIRPPQIIRSDNYIGENSLNLLKRELGQ